MGDYNEGTPLYQPSPSLGVIYRYNFNKIYSLRFSASYSGLKGSYSSYNHYLPGAVGSFSKQIVSAEILVESNFLTFNTQDPRRNSFAPYVILGVGGAYISGSMIPQFPFGVGVKYCPVQRITVGCEWRLHKTFNDNIDGYQGVYDGSKPFFHNNDWFSFVGLFITFRLYNNNYTCPAYR